jgi:hypothetical protein
METTNLGLGVSQVTDSFFLLFPLQLEWRRRKCLFSFLNFGGSDEGWKFARLRMCMIGNLNFLLLYLVSGFVRPM